METGKGPSGCTLPGVPSCSGVSQQVDSCLLVARSTTGFVLTGPTVGWLEIPAPCHQDGACSICPYYSACQGLPGWPVTSWESLFPKWQSILWPSPPLPATLTGVLSWAVTAQGSGAPKTSMGQTGVTSSSVLSLYLQHP